MLFDWFTVGAQALNFLILVWLMKRFLFKPILHAIDERERRISTELADADAKKAEAQEERLKFHDKNEEFEQQRAALLNKATQEVKAERQRLLEEARRAADALTSKRQESLLSDANNLNRDIRRQTREEVFAITRRVLKDLATTDLEERFVEVFTRRLRELDGQARGAIAAALGRASASGIVRSAFDLPAQQRAVIQNALNETFSADIQLTFKSEPDLISGIEFATEGQKVSWTIADYLATMEKRVGDLVDPHTTPPPSSP